VGITFEEQPDLGIYFLREGPQTIQKLPASYTVMLPTSSMFENLTDAFSQG